MIEIESNYDKRPCKLSCEIDEFPKIFNWKGEKSVPSLVHFQLGQPVSCKACTIYKVFLVNLSVKATSDAHFIYLMHRFQDFFFLAEKKP